MAILKGIPVTLIDRKQTGTDPFGSPIYGDVEVVVPNVLITPTSTDDVTNQLNLTGKHAVYTLAIPKGDKNTWEGREVRFFGQRWRVIGLPQEGLEHLIPLDWNKKVQVERYE